MLADVAQDQGLKRMPTDGIRLPIMRAGTSVGRRFVGSSDVQFTDGQAASGATFQINDAVRFQKIDGFGASIMEAGIMTLNTLPPDAETGNFVAHRRGVEEYIYVLRGRMRATKPRGTRNGNKRAAALAPGSQFASSPNRVSSSAGSVTALLSACCQRGVAESASSWFAWGVMAIMCALFCDLAFSQTTPRCRNG